MPAQEARVQNAPARRFRVQLVLSFAICAVAIYAVYFPLRDAWTVNHASVLVNRAIVQKQSRSQAATNSDIAKAMSLIDAATSRGTHSTFREAPMWRVYGAAASASPSETSFKKLAEASDAGLMDHFGVLSLGDVATSTGHWAEAEKAFTKIDASNLLIDRADKSFEANHKQQAIHEYLHRQPHIGEPLPAARRESDVPLQDRTGDPARGRCEDVGAHHRGIPRFREEAQPRHGHDAVHLPHAGRSAGQDAARD
jgi:hypothetical protein